MNNRAITPSSIAAARLAPAGLKYQRGTFSLVAAAMMLVLMLLSWLVIIWLLDTIEARRTEIAARAAAETILRELYKPGDKVVVTPSLGQLTATVKRIARGNGVSAAAQLTVDAITVADDSVAVSLRNQRQPKRRYQAKARVVAAGAVALADCLPLGLNVNAIPAQADDGHSAFLVKLNSKQELQALDFAPLLAAEKATLPLLSAGDTVMGRAAKTTLLNQLAEQVGKTVVLPLLRDDTVISFARVTIDHLDGENARLTLRLAPSSLLQSARLGPVDFQQHSQTITTPRYGLVLDMVLES